VAWSPPEPISTETIGTALRELGARNWQVEAIAQVIAEAFVRTDQTAESDENAPS
jgi:ribonuclease D